jgi:hypothetical protein
MVLHAKAGAESDSDYKLISDTFSTSYPGASSVAATGAFSTRNLRTRALLRSRPWKTKSELDYVFNFNFMIFPENFFYFTIFLRIFFAQIYTQTLLQFFTTNLKLIFLCVCKKNYKWLSLLNFSVFVTEKHVLAVSQV